MAAGLAIFGLAGYVFVTVTGRTLSKSDANAAIAFYFLVNVLGPGIFYALEQVTSRTTSSALAAGRPLGPAMRRVRAGGLGLVAAVTAAVLLLAPVMVKATLHDDWALFAGVLATPAIAGGLHLVRGLLGGHRRFGGYAATLAVEGTARLLLSLLLAAAGTNAAWAYGVSYLAASAIAVLAGLLWLRRGAPARDAGLDAEPGHEARPAGFPQPETGPEIGPATPEIGPATGPAVGKSLAALAVATLFAQLLPNIAPLVVTSRLAEDSATALAFGQAAVIARIPLLLFFPIQTMLLPSLAAAVTRNELDLVTRRIRLTLVAVAGFGAASTVVFMLLGRWVLRTFFATDTDLGQLIMLLLGVSTVVLIAAYAVQPALVALHRDRAVTTGWAIGSAVTIGLALLPADPVTIASIAQLIGPALTLVAVLLALRTGLRAPVSPGPAHLPAAASPNPPAADPGPTTSPNSTTAGATRE